MKIIKSNPNRRFGPFYVCLAVKFVEQLSKLHRPFSTFSWPNIVEVLSCRLFPPTTFDSPQATNSGNLACNRPIRCLMKLPATKDGSNWLLQSVDFPSSSPTLLQWNQEPMALLEMCPNRLEINQWLRWQWFHDQNRPEMAKVPWEECKQSHQHSTCLFQSCQLK